MASSRRQPLGGSQDAGYVAIAVFLVKQDMGKVMSLEMSELKGKAEGGLISNVVKELL